jgi:hypothetical protein
MLQSSDQVDVGSEAYSASTSNSTVARRVCGFVDELPKPERERSELHLLFPTAIAGARPRARRSRRLDGDRSPEKLRSS